MRCYVHWNGGAWFVKEAKFLQQQKNESLMLYPDGRPWWNAWKLLEKDCDGIEHARLLAKVKYGERGERWVK